jgi:hypothetical protein
MQRNTALCLPDLPDPEQKPCTVAQDIEEALIDKIGLTLWGCLIDKLMEIKHESG